MKLYGGIDLHGNNSVIVLLGDDNRVIYEKRLPNEISLILNELYPHRDQIIGLAVESTYNWYWLVDGLMDAGYDMHLVNTSAVIQYSGLKYADDNHDARWLAKLLRLGILPEGYIYPKESRSLRDLLRKRGQLVRQRTMNLLSLQSILARSVGQNVSCSRIKKMTEEDLEELLPDTDTVRAASSNLRVYGCLASEVRSLEKEVLGRLRLTPEYTLLTTVNGIGNILALTIMLEVGDIGRFRKAGNFVSYCRCVRSERMSNGKRKGTGNRKNGNKYLAWAFVEAANCAIRYDDRIKSYYQRKKSKTKRVIALKAVAHKLARACYHILTDQVPFDVNRAFGH